MAKTKTTQRRINQRPRYPKKLKQQYQPKNKSVPTHSKDIGVKRVKLSKRQSAKWKIKRFTPPPRYINVNNKGQLVRKMIVRRSAIYPDATGGTY